MRKLIAIGMLVGGLLGVAAPAMAQFADPLSLAASGVVVPYFGGGGNLSLLEVASPVGGNPALHMFFFDATCQRVGDSVGLGETVNDIAHYNPALVAGSSSGLIAIAASDVSGFNLLPLQNPIHSRLYWITPGGRSRALEPITLDTFGLTTPGHIWNPLRTAATFFAPPDILPFVTTVYFICPRFTIQGAAPVDAFPTSLFPNVSVPGPGFSTGASNLRARVYNTKEDFLRDIRPILCDCLTTRPLSAISTVYSTLPDAALGTYTEIESDASAPPGDHSWTGYRSIEIVGTSLDFFGRLSNGNRGLIQGTGPSPASGR